MANETYKLILGDCLEIMPTLEAGSVDAIICDPPYGQTACAWDSVIPFAPMWECIKRVTKPRGAVVLFGSQPFTSALVMSNAEWFRYQWVWEKSRPSGFINCDSAPLKNIEDICVFSDGSAVYNPQMTQAERVVERSRKVKAHITVCATDRIRQFDNGGLAYPRSVLRFANPNHDNNHPTQKPVDLLAYLIKTYTQPGETVLDFTMGSGSTGVACAETGRKFIGIELDAGYFAIAQDRIETAYRRANGEARRGKPTDTENLPLFA